MPCNDINELKSQLCCQLELDEYDDGHLSIECKTCNKVLFEIYPLLLPIAVMKKIKKKERYNGRIRKNYHISR